MNKDEKQRLLAVAGKKEKERRGKIFFLLSLSSSHNSCTWGQIVVARESFLRLEEEKCWCQVSGDLKSLHPLFPSLC